jgi:4-diphosphocytidyl-2-C-methyl-D-erythritol kinase
MTLTRTAPAKINLTLEILGRREDGYHAIRSVMQTISLHDTISVRNAPAGVITLEGGSPEAPPTDDNLVLKAARALLCEAGNAHGAHITLDKRVPVGAGLGGGSSDAAATLLALNDLWRARIPLPTLVEIAATLGSDVPFFLTNGSALAEGRGEILTPIPSYPPIWLAVVKPEVSLRTPDVFREYDLVADPGRAPGGNAAQTMIEALRQRAGGQHVLTHIAGALCNDLEDAAVRLCPELDGILGRLHAAGSPGVLLSGSGSAVFALANTEAQVKQLAAVIPSREAWSAVAHTVSLPYDGR